MALELVLERLLELLAEDVHPSAGQLVVEVRYHEVERHLHLDVHLGLCWENLRAVAGRGSRGILPRTFARSAVLPRTTVWSSRIGRWPIAPSYLSFSRCFTRSHAKVSPKSVDL